MHLNGGAFARLMYPFGPLEPAPRIAAAVSGGSDSLALALLAADWVKILGGALTALVVDHRLRPESTAEARITARLLRANGIPAVILTRIGPLPRTGIETAARDARYALMGDWCAAHGILHLLIAHNLGDQAETTLLRLAAGSGLDGLAAMPAVQETRWGRLLRPLLAVPRESLRQVLRDRGLEWIEDPSNANETFARVRLRHSAAALAGEGLRPGRLSRTAARIGEGRAVLEGASAAVLAVGVWVHPAGFAQLDRAVIARAPRDVAWRALERVIRTIGGAPYSPRSARLQGLFDQVCGAETPKARTLGGCLVRPQRGGVLIAREPAAIGAEIAVDPGAEAVWDGRFRLRISPKCGANRRLRLAALGCDGWRVAKAAGTVGIGMRIPPAVCVSLPALHDRRGLVEVPHLGYVRNSSHNRPPLVESIVFAPPHPLAATEFSVV